jgi:hypothetical protein
VRVFYWRPEKPCSLLFVKSGREALLAAVCEEASKAVCSAESAKNYAELLALFIPLASLQQEPACQGDPWRHRRQSAHC